LKHIIIINNSGTIPSELSNFISFNEIPTNHVDLSTIQKDLSEHDVVNLQFTSGTTGSPKAAMLTHQYAPLCETLLIKVISSIMESLSEITWP
jgi:long-subunit acyl-CoA synthetase (AMP-forming)